MQRILAALDLRGVVITMPDPAATSRGDANASGSMSRSRYRNASSAYRDAGME
jgi:hypothetical protein